MELNCPRCKNALSAKNEINYCEQHGVLLRHDDFKKHTSKKFSQVFWSALFSLTQLRGLSCPDCKSRMIILNPKSNKKLELDCCPNCYAIWLDKGEATDLHLAFLAFEAEETGPAKAKEIAELQYLIGKELIEQDERIQRYEKITAVANSLNKRVRYRFIGTGGIS